MRSFMDSRAASTSIGKVNPTRTSAQAANHVGDTGSATAIVIRSRNKDGCCLELQQRCRDSVHTQWAARALSLNRYVVHARSCDWRGHLGTRTRSLIGMAGTQRRIVIGGTQTGTQVEDHRRDPETIQPQLDRRDDKDVCCYETSFRVGDQLAI